MTCARSKDTSLGYVTWACAINPPTKWVDATGSRLHLVYCMSRSGWSPKTVNTKAMSIIHFPSGYVSDCCQWKDSPSWSFRGRRIHIDLMWRTSPSQQGNISVPNTYCTWCHKRSHLQSFSKVMAQRADPQRVGTSQPTEHGAGVLGVLAKATKTLLGGFWKCLLWSCLHLKHWWKKENSF